MHEVKFFKAKPSPDRHGKTGRAERGGLAVTLACVPGQSPHH